MVNAIIASHRVQFLQIGDACVFDVEATGFGVAKQAFDGPPPAVMAQGVFGLTITGDDQPFTIPDAPRDAKFNLFSGVHSMPGNQPDHVLIVLVERYLRNNVLKGPF